MRIVYTSTDQKKARMLAHFLTGEGIANELDVAVDTDWGSNHYGEVNCRLWIIDEDKVDDALRWIDLFEQEPNNPVFTAPAATPAAAPEPPPPFMQKLKNSPLPQRLSKGRRLLAPRPAASFAAITGKITIYLVMLCTALLIFSEATSPPFSPYPASLPPLALFSSPVKKQMLYDYPHAFTLVDKAVKLYGIEKLQTPDELPAEGKFLLKQFYQTPYWQGIYAPLVHYLQAGTPFSSSMDAPLFEKIQEGEVWRLVTPALLHNDILHLLFNMLWLIVLGRQLEQRMGGTRYLVFIALTALFSNAAQYLMSGANFMGFSGVICAMLTFIWVRQRRTPWEGYQLDKMTMLFMTFFILAMLGIQLVSFYLEVSGHGPISPGIANTAHLAGALSGLLLGYIPFFKWKTAKK